MHTEPVLGILQVPACIFQNWLVEKFNLAGRTRGIHQAGDRIDQEAKLVFRPLYLFECFLQRRLRSLTSGDVPDKTGEGTLISAGNGPEGNLGRKLRSILSAANQLAAGGAFR